MKIFVFLFFLPTFLCAAPQLVEMIVQGHTEPSHTSTITQKNIQQKQYQSAVSLFKAHPSLEIKNVGGVTSLFVRGTKSNHNVVILNGFIINDPSSNNQFDFSTLDPNAIDTVEIITGAKALYYGSGSLGGVIKITTKTAQEGTSGRGHFEAGSFDTRKVNISLGHRTEALGILGNVNIGHSGSKTRWNHHHQIHNADRNRSTGGSVFLDSQVSKQYHSSLYFQGEERRTHINDFIQGKTQYSGDRTFHYNNRLIFKNDLSWMEGRWQHRLTLGQQNSRRKTISQDSRTYIAKHESVDYETTFEGTKWIVLYGGMNYAREADLSHQIPGRVFDSKGIRAKIDIIPLENLELFLSTRLDKHERFNAFSTWQSGVSWDATNTITLEASMGTGFKSPSIQTFVGSNSLQQPNMNAKPEKSFLWDITLKHSFLKEKLKTQVSYFINEIKDILVWDWASRTNTNKEKRSIRGIEISINYALNEHWKMGGSFTYLRAFDREPASRTLSIPRYKTSFELIYKPIDKLSLFTEAVHKSRQMNYNNKRTNAVSDIRLGGRYHWNKSIEIFGRLENALNQKIEESYGHGRRGFGIFGGFVVKT